jgi:hypothetical protein
MKHLIRRAACHTITAYNHPERYISQSDTMETAVAQWLRYCATNQEVADSILDGVMEFFTDINPSDPTMALGSTQPLTEMSTRSISWG